MIFLHLLPWEDTGHWRGRAGLPCALGLSRFRPRPSGPVLKDIPGQSGTCSPRTGDHGPTQAPNTHAAGGGRPTESRREGGSHREPRPGEASSAGTPPASECPAARGPHPHSSPPAPRKGGLCGDSGSRAQAALDTALPGTQVTDLSQSPAGVAQPGCAVSRRR